jgi:glycosyltransferase involved in cell wall biosynthesis
VRVALVRGTHIGAWDLPNYDLGPEHQVDVVLTRGARVDVGPPFGVRRLRSPADVVGRLGPRAAGGLELLLGTPQYLVGLERSLEGYDIAAPVELESSSTVQAVGARQAGRCRRVVATVMENVPLKAQPARVERRVAAAAAGVDRCIAITERARVHLRTAGVPDERIDVIPMGTDLARFRPADAPRRPGPVRVLSVSRLEFGKGVEDLVVAAGLLGGRGVELELTFAGRGPLRERLEQLAARLGIAERLHFAAMPWTEIERAYQDADLFVLASGPTRNWREQFGFAVIEAMACGLPVLVGESGSLPEVVGRRESLVAPHDSVSLADRLEELVSDPDLRRELGGWNRRRAEERYDQRRVREQILAVYERALSDPARAA